MKKILRISIVLLLICSFLVPQNTQGVFQVAIGDKVAYKIVEASHDITVSSTHDTFTGCSNDGTIINTGSTIVVEVSDVTTTDLTWNSTNISPEMVETCPSDLNPIPYYDFCLAVYFFLSGDFDLPTIIISGTIDPVYFDPFEIPLFVDPKPQTWIDIAAMESFLETTVPSMFSSWDTLTINAIYTEVGNNMTFSCLFSAADSEPSISIEFDSFSVFSYNMTTGELLKADNHFTVNGVYTSASFSTISDYNLEKTDVPDESLAPFNFLEFLSENKWYFIGGGGGILVIGATVGIVLGVRKAKGSKKKSSKKKK